MNLRLLPALALAVMSVVSCTESASPSTTAPETSTSTSELNEVTIRMDWIPSPTHVPFHVASELGYYGDEGLEVTILDGQGSGAAAQLVAAGEDTFGLVGGTAVVDSVATGLPIVEVASIYPTTGMCTTVLADSGIESMNDLAGRIWAASASSLNLQTFPATLEAWGVDADSVEIQTLDAASLTGALMAGTIDGTDNTRFGLPPQLLEEGVDLRLFCHADVDMDTVGWGVITNLDTAADHPDIVEGFVKASLRGIRFVIDNPEESVDIVVNSGVDFGPADVVETQVMDLARALAEVETTRSLPFGQLSEAEWENTIRIVNLANEGEGSELVEVDVSALYTDDFLP